MAELTLDSVSEWSMGKDDYHPFHLHTHHFQIAGKILLKLYLWRWKYSTKDC